MVLFVNFVFYQVGWFACVLGAAWGAPGLGMGLATALVAAHFFLTTNRTSQLQLGLAAAAVGLVIDTSQLALGVFRFPTTTTWEWLPPIWMTVLWVQFATTFQYSMRWLSGRYTLAAAFALVGAPAAFFAGERFGAVEFLQPRVLHYGLLAAFWSIAVPLLVYISDQLASGEEAAGYRWFTSYAERAAAK
jgi:hypothetical protein